MTTLQNRIPKYRHHKAKGLAVVTLDGRDIYLGRYGTEKSKREYQRITGEWLANGRKLPAPPARRFRITVAEIILAHLEYAEQRYVLPNGEQSSQVQSIKEAMRPLRYMYGNTPAVDFGPLALKNIRNVMINDDDLARSTVNKRIDLIKRAFKWAAAEELIPAEVHTALSKVEGLRRRELGVRESDPVKPVADEHVEVLKPHLSNVVWSMIQVQRMTGMRPGEVVIMRGCDIDTNGPVWTYTPQRHKTEHHGHSRVIFIGPKAQEVLRPFLRPNLSEYLFSPADATTEQRAKRTAARTTPLSCGNRPGTNRKRKPARTAGNRYTRDTYRRAIERACDAAFPPPAHLARKTWPSGKPAEGKGAWLARLTPEQRQELEAWRRKHRWHPNQLRHTFATEIRRHHGLEASQVLLGHAKANVTQVYAERDHDRARKVIGAVG